MAEDPITHAGSTPMPLAIDDIEQIESTLLSLPRTARVRILEALSASLEVDPDIERAWNEENLRRLAEVKAGRAEMIEGEEFDRELDERLK
ncbi:MAG TPA: addiction module protein [Longimicrobium sp.]|nr:addiction module protein [Longimicrobium sp.]